MHYLSENEKEMKEGTSNIFSQIKWHSRTKRLATLGLNHTIRRMSEFYYHIS
jgi:hypothetical protein